MTERPNDADVMVGVELNADLATGFRDPQRELIRNADLTRVMAYLYPLPIAREN